MTTATRATTRSVPKRKAMAFRWRSFVSVFLFFQTIVLGISGVVLYIAPSGRIVNTYGWRFLLFTKEQWEAIHTIWGLAFIIVAIYHIKYNWRSFLGYMKARVKRLFNLRREFVAAVVVSVLLMVVSAANVPPVQQIMDFGENLNTYWEEHLSQSTNLSGEEVLSHGGYGRYTVADLAAQNNISVVTALERLKAYGIEAHATDDLLTLSEQSGYTPGELSAIIEGLPPEAHQEEEDDH
ncbi:MAG: DUF4405 domain-containing protein [Chloroflexi bacterium]|nr:DUF4405 domain-containing protein [Chloroflexota bacterium]